MVEYRHIAKNGHGLYALLYHGRQQGAQYQKQQVQSKGHWSVSPPAPTFSSSGLYTGRPSGSYLQHVHDFEQADATCNRCAGSHSLCTVANLRLLGCPRAKMSSLLPSTLRALLVRTSYRQVRYLTGIACGKADAS